MFDRTLMLVMALLRLCSAMVLWKGCKSIFIDELDSMVAVWLVVLVGGFEGVLGERGGGTGGILLYRKLIRFLRRMVFRFFFIYFSTFLMRRW